MKRLLPIFALSLLLSASAVAQCVNCGSGGGGTSATGIITACGASNNQLLFDNAGSCAGTAGITSVGTGQLALALGTITTNLLAVNITGTWNNAGVTFDAPVFVNITNTAAGTTSKLFDLQQGSTSAFSFQPKSFGSANNFVMQNTNSGTFKNQVVLQDPAGTHGFTFGNDFNSNQGDNFYVFSNTQSTAQFFIVPTAEIRIPNNLRFGFSSGNDASATSADTILTRKAAANWQLGNADAAAPVAQILSVQSVIAGTTNTAGATTTIIGSLSTGTGVSGDVLVQTGGTGAGATTQNTATTALTIKGASQHILGGGASAPTANACAGFALGTGSSDTNGRVAFTSATSCAINFGQSYTNAPFCVVAPGSAASTVEATTTTGILTATFGTAQTAMFYHCFGT